MREYNFQLMISGKFEMPDDTSPTEAATVVSDEALGIADRIDKNAIHCSIDTITSGVRQSQPEQMGYQQGTLGNNLGALPPRK